MHTNSSLIRARCPRRYSQPNSASRAVACWYSARLACWGNGVDMGVSAPAKNLLLRLREQGKYPLCPACLLRGPHQVHRGPVESFAGGLAVGAEIGTHQQLIHPIANVGQADAADGADIVLRQGYGKIVCHCLSFSPICGACPGLKNRRSYPARRPPHESAGKHCPRP